jgi:hypothetical protein
MNASYRQRAVSSHIAYRHALNGLHGKPLRRRPQAPLRLGDSHCSDRIQPSRNYSTSKWSLVSDGSSLTAASSRSHSFPLGRLRRGLRCVTELLKGKHSHHVRHFDHSMFTGVASGFGGIDGERITMSANLYNSIWYMPPFQQ